MYRKYSSFLFIGIFVLSMLFVYIAGNYRKSITAESGVFNLKLLSNESLSRSKTVIYDVQNEGIPKKIIQPDKISISTGHGSGVVNACDTPIQFSVKVTGIKGNAKILSTNPKFDEKSNSCLNPLMPGETMNLSINMDLPNEDLKNRVITKGLIEFYNGNLKIGEVPLEVINSNPNENCCEN